jgi:hypothetical protein
MLLIGFYFNGAKILLFELLPRIPRRYLSIENCIKLKKLKQRFSNIQGDDFLRLAEIIRDKIQFHFDSDIITSQILDGSPSADILIGTTNGMTIFDCTYHEPYSFIFSYLAKAGPEEIEMEDRIKWLSDKSLVELSEYCTLLEQIANKYFRKYGQLEEGDIE